MHPVTAPTQQVGTMTGADAVLRTLEMMGCDVVFGLPGGAALPLYDALTRSRIRHVLMRHEQGAGHAAEGYAHASGRVGVCLATSGPGATNLVTPLADAYMDSVPLVAITGQVGSSGIGRDAFQEADVVGITLPVTKHNFKIRDAGDISKVLRDAFKLASCGRPGPVLVDIPKDVQQAEASFDFDELPTPSSGNDKSLDQDAVEEAVTLMHQSRHPVIYVGGGVVKAHATGQLRELVDHVGAPVVTTLMARGAFPDSHPLCLGMPGMHGTYAAVTAMQKADLLIAIGTRFDDRVTGRLDAFAPHARVIHVDIDPVEIGKNRNADVALVGDARSVLDKLLDALAAGWNGGQRREIAEWVETTERWRSTYPLRYERAGPLKPQFVIERLSAVAGPAALVVTGVGQHQMWAAQYVKREEPRTFITSGGLGTMGFAVPAALGAKVAQPNRPVVAIDGDGCFQMTAQELATAVVERIPFVVVVINNGSLGMVRQWQHLFYERRESHVRLPSDVPDVVGLAEAYGAEGIRIEAEGEVDATFEAALRVTDRPVVIDVRVDPAEMCFPLVPAGASNDDIMLAPPPDIPKEGNPWSASR